MEATITFTKDEVDALTIAISDAEYWARQMRRSDNYRDAELYQTRADVLKGILIRNDSN